MRFRISSHLLFGLVLAFALTMVGWWTLLQIDDARRVVATGAPDEVEHAHRRIRMFASEGIAFALVLVIAGMLYLRAARAERQLAQRHDRFLAAATHELKTPLATLRLLLESLRAGSLPDHKRDRYIQTGLLEADRLDRGLTNVLTAAGLRTARVPAGEAGDLADDLRAALQGSRPRAEAAEVRLVVGELPPVPFERHAESMQLALGNLLENAVKYSRPGGVVEVALALRGEIAEITITDHGHGFTPAEAEHAFQPFWRGGDDSRGGTGLGLFLVRAIVEEHGGEVQIRSAGRDRGSTLCVRLPRRRRAA